MEVIYTLVGALVGAVLTFIIGFLTLKYNYHQLYAQTVSSNRMEWINVWREEISTFISCAKMLHKCENVSYKKFNKNACLQKLEYSRSMITIRLNLNEDLHRLMFASINSLDWRADNEKFRAECEYIEELARSILKIEWERVKSEAKGRRI